MHESDPNRVMSGVADEMRKEAPEVGDERSRCPLELDIVVIGGAHCESYGNVV